MSTASGRRALSNRTQQTSTSHVPLTLAEHLSASQSKRARGTLTSTSLREKERKREREREDRLDKEQQKQEFREKYSRAFPSWTFYFDLDNIGLKGSLVKQLTNRIESLGGHIEDFFSRDISHVITDKPVTATDSAKENRPNSKGSSSKALFTVKSPVQFKPKGGDDVVAKALGYGIKVWNTTKLDSVLYRCLDTTSVLVSNPPPPKTAPTQKLERLLSKEKHYGPGDRDPNQKRHDYRYFSKGSFFVLVEDMRGEVATIAAHEYPAPKDKGKSPWPVLHCHPLARGPFIPFDEKEKQRWERAQQKKLEEKMKPEAEQKVATRPRTNSTTRPRFPFKNGRSQGDLLRRSVSLNNLKRKGHLSPEALERDGEGDIFDSANASGFISGAAHMAASGNSVGITSATGTTSTAGGFRTSTLPLGMELAMKRQVVTSKKVAQANKTEGKRLGNMDPPPTLPTKNVHESLKRSKSTSFRPPKREEGMKPGYCECCRMKFEDFKTHIVSNKHRRFAENDSNFVGLDEILGRVKRRTLREVELEEQRRVERCYLRCNGLTSSSPVALPFPDSTP